MASLETIVDQVRDYLDNDDWKYEYIEEKNLIKCGVNLKCKLQNVNLTFTLREDGYTTYAICNMKADEETRKVIMEYLTMANYGLRAGNFELDLRDGEIRYKVNVNAKGLDGVSTKIIEDSIMIPLMMMDRYGDGLAALLLGFSDPQTEIQKAESN